MLVSWELHFITTPWLSHTTIILVRDEEYFRNSWDIIVIAVRPVSSPRADERFGQYLSVGPMQLIFPWDWLYLIYYQRKGSKCGRSAAFYPSVGDRPPFKEASLAPNRRLFPWWCIHCSNSVPPSGGKLTVPQMHCKAEGKDEKAFSMEMWLLEVDGIMRVDVGKGPMLEMPCFE